MTKHKNSMVITDGKKAIDIWNGDEGWTIHSGEEARINAAITAWSLSYFAPCIKRAEALRICRLS